MSGDPCEAVHLLLQAELDGELDAAGSAGLASHLAACDACCVLHGQLGTLSAQLHEMPRYEVPAELRRAVAALAPRRRRRSPWPAWSHAGAFGAGLAAAACVAALLLPRAGPATGSDLVDAHLRALQPGHLIDMPSSDRHTVKPWFNGRIGISPNVPDLAPQGFPILGGRMDYVGGRPAAVLVYGRRSHVIDVFVQDGATVAAVQTSGGYNVAHWTSGGLSYRAVSDLNKDELAEFTTLMRTQDVSPDGREQAR